MSEIVTSSPSQNATREVFRKGLCVRVSIGNKPWKMTLTPADFGLDKFPDNFEPGRRLLLPKQALQKIKYIEGRARAVVDQFADHYGSDGRFKASWVHERHLGTVVAVLRKLEQDFWKEVDDLIENYEKHQATMKEAYADQWEVLKDAYIPKAKVRERYYFTCEIYEVSVPDQMDLLSRLKIDEAALLLATREEASKRTRAEMAQMKRDYEAQLESSMKQIQEQAQRNAERLVEGAVLKHRAAVVDLFKGITDRITSGKPVNQSHIANMRHVLTEVRTLASMDTVDFHAKLDEVTAWLDQHSTSNLSMSSVTDALNKQLQSALSYVESTSVDAVAQAQQSTFKRELRLS